jgi:hypothetical protein
MTGLQSEAGYVFSGVFPEEFEGYSGRNSHHYHIIDHENNYPELNTDQAMPYITVSRARVGAFETAGNRGTENGSF